MEPNGRDGIQDFTKSRTNIDGWYPRRSSNLYEISSTKKRSYEFGRYIVQTREKIVCDHTMYLLCANICYNLIVMKDLVVRKKVTDSSPTNDISIGVMVIEKDFQAQHDKN